MTIPLNITVDKLEKLWNIKRMSQLSSPIIFETQDTEDYDDDLRDLIVKNLGGDSDIMVVLMKKTEPDY